MINIIFNGQASSESMGGGDKIVINIAAILAKKGMPISFIGCPEGHEMVNREVPHLKFKEINRIKVDKWGLVGAYILRILASLKMVFFDQGKNGMVWSSSDYLPDSIPGFIHKLFNPNSKWLLNMFLDARNPFKGEVPFRANFILSYISQRITLKLFAWKGDHIFVLSHPDVDYVKSFNISEEKISRIFGGFNIEEFDAVAQPEKTEYAACYVGRFHHQKGLPHMIYAWEQIVKEFPDAKLAIVGWGAENEVDKLNKLIADHKLEDNTELLGFLDGEEKIRVIKNSDLLLFPSNYESWGVSAAEGIACGKPVVAYKLSQIKDNFPGGIYWVDPENKIAYSKAVLDLMRNEKIREKYIKSGEKIKHTLSWEYSADKVYDKIIEL